jgi:hypothetical protein
MPLALVTLTSSCEGQRTAGQSHSRTAAGKAGCIPAMPMLVTVLARWSSQAFE